MTADTPNQAQDHATIPGPPPVRALLFTILSLLAEAAAVHVGANVPNVGGPVVESKSDGGDLSEARLAIDAANALLAAVGGALTSNERLAIEGLLTQLQVAYVKRSGA
jgi:hypothetical protein